MTAEDQGSHSHCPQVQVRLSLLTAGSGRGGGGDNGGVENGQRESVENGGMYT